MAKWLWPEDLLQAFKEIPYGEETTTDKDESDADLSVESVDVDDADHDSQSKADISEDEEFSAYDETGDDIGNFCIGRDKQTRWRKTQIAPRSKIRGKNIVKKIPGPTSHARDAYTELEAYLKIMDIDIIDEIVKCTKYMQGIRHKFAREHRCTETSRNEIMALLGLLYLIGTRKGHHANVRELWTADGTGIQILRACMSYDCFLFLLQCTRFDDLQMTPERRQTDKLAPIRTIVDIFVKNCQQCYNTSEFTTIDEMLHPFRGCCSFIQYMPNKPAKYGVKIFALCDAKTFYCSNLEIYCGKQLPGPYDVRNTATDIVKRLVSPIENSNKNVTTDNWYMNIPLLHYLLEKKTTLLGTVRKNKREIPPEFLPTKERQPGESMFGFQKDKVLVSFIPKRNKAVILVSSMHDSGGMDEVTKKPEIILDYNMTKGGVDTCDKMCASYSVSCVTRRWPLAVFYILMNIADINSWMIYAINTPSDEPQRRILFLKNLSLSLMKEHLVSRSQIPSLPRDVSTFLEKYHPLPVEDDGDGIAGRPPKKRRSCFICGRQKNSSASMKSDQCNRFICKQHSKKQISCANCGDVNVITSSQCE